MSTDTQTCRWHPDRRAGVVCQRCDTPICPSCMHQASVGFHCPDCVRAGRQRVVHGPAAFRRADLRTATYVLMAVNVAVFVWQSAQGVGRGLQDFALNGFWVAEQGEWYRLVTSAFMHANVLHLAVNMFALWVLGPTVNRFLGRGYYVLVYAASLMAGSAGAVLVNPRAFTVGASGAIYGLLGALVVLFRRHGISLWQSGLGLTLLLNFFLTVGLANISIGGHAGGFVGGLVATLLLVEAGQRVRERGVLIGVVVAMIPVFLLVGLWGATTWRSPLFG